MIIDIEKQKYILDITRGLPPESCQNIFLTEDQKKYFQEHREYWILVSLGLKLYFSGQSIKKGLNSRINSYALEIISQEVKKYLKIYELLNFGWEEIEQQANDQNIKMIATEPGEAFRYILNQTAIYNFNYCLMPYNEFSPRKMYKTLNKEKKIAKKEASGVKISSLDKKWRIDIEKEFNRNMPNNGQCEAYDFKEFCLEVCSNYAETKDVYREYKNIEKKLVKLIKRDLSSNGTARFEKWHEGKLLGA